MPSKRRAAAAGSVTITDLAREAGVSKSTVSLVLHDSPLIRAETAGRVRDAAQKLGYVYNRRAADLRRRSSNIIGIVINDLANPFFAELLVGMERRLVEAGVPFVSVHAEIFGAMGHYYDMHENNFGMLRDENLPILDMGYPALIQDLDERVGDGNVQLRQDQQP